MQRNKRKETGCFRECTTFQDFEDIIRIPRIHTKMTEVAKQNEKFRMSLGRRYQVAVVMSEICELCFCDFFLCFFYARFILRLFSVMSSGCWKQSTDSPLPVFRCPAIFDCPPLSLSVVRGTCSSLLFVVRYPFSGVRGPKE